MLLCAHVVSVVAARLPLEACRRCSKSALLTFTCVQSTKVACNWIMACRSSKFRSMGVCVPRMYSERPVCMTQLRAWSRCCTGLYDGYVMGPQVIVSGRRTLARVRANEIGDVFPSDHCCAWCADVAADGCYFPPDKHQLTCH